MLVYQRVLIPLVESQWWNPLTLNQPVGTAHRTGTAMHLPTQQSSNLSTNWTKKSYPGQFCVFHWFGWHIPITNRHNATNKLDHWTDFIKLYKTIKIVYSLSNYINKTSTQDYSSHLFTLSCTQSFQSSHLSPLHLDVATWFRWHSQPRQSVGARPVRLMCWGIHKVVSSSWDYIKKT